MYLGRFNSFRSWWRQRPFRISPLWYIRWVRENRPLFIDLWANLKFAYTFTMTQHALKEESISDYFKVRKGMEINRKSLVSDEETVNYCGHLYKRVD